MKKIFLSLFAIAIAATVYAEGYQINTLSTRQLGMGHVGAGMKLGAENMLFNPAGMAFMDKTLDISAGVTGIAPNATATTPDGNKYKSESQVSTPFYIYAGFRVYDNFKAGISFTTPYGSSIDWTDNWPGAVLNQRVKLTTYSVQPTLSYKITPNLSIGAGLMISWGKVNLDKALINSKSMDLLMTATGQDFRFGNTAPASANLQGTANMAFGFNVGAMYDVTKNLTIGASFRSKMNAKVNAGIASVTYANELAEKVLSSKIGIINKANFSAEMPLPYIFTIGTSYKVSPKLLLAFDAQLTGWNAYKTLTIDFAEDQVKPLNQYLKKNYSNAWAFRAGAQYAITPRMDLRAGLSYDCTPVSKEYYNPETPGMDKISPSLGFSFRPVNRLSIDVALSYVAGLGQKGASYTYEDLILKTLGKPYESKFTADYKVHAWCMAVGLGYSF